MSLAVQTAMHPQRAVNVGRALMGVTYLAVSLLQTPDQPMAQPIVRGLLSVYALWVTTATVLANRNWRLEARLAVPLMLVDWLTFAALLWLTGGFFSPIAPVCVPLMLIALMNTPTNHRISGPLVVSLIYVGAALAAPHSTLQNPAIWDDVLLGLIHALLAATIMAAYFGTDWLLDLRAEFSVKIDKILSDHSREAGIWALEAFLLTIGAKKGAILWRDLEQGASGATVRGLDAALATDLQQLSIDPLFFDEHIALHHSSLSLMQRREFNYRPIRRKPTNESKALLVALDRSEAMTVPIRCPGFRALVIITPDNPLTEALLVKAMFAASKLEKRLSEYRHAFAAQRHAEGQARQAISRDLHDSVLQSLASIRMLLHPLLSGTLKLPEKSKARLATIDAIAGDEAIRLRALIGSLAIDDSEMVDLGANLSAIAAPLGTQWQINCELTTEDSDGAIMANGHTARELGFAMRELVANAVKHGAASAVSFDLRKTKTEVCLIAANNGRNFSESGKPDWGPHTVFDRMTNLGARFAIQTHAEGVVAQICFDVGTL